MIRYIFHLDYYTHENCLLQLIFPKEILKVQRHFKLIDC